MWMVAAFSKINDLLSYCSYHSHATLEISQSTTVQRKFCDFIKSKTFLKENHILLSNLCSDAGLGWAGIQVDKDSRRHRESTTCHQLCTDKMVYDPSLHCQHSYRSPEQTRAYQTNWLQVQIHLTIMCIPVLLSRMNLLFTISVSLHLFDTIWMHIKKCMYIILCKCSSLERQY